MSGRTFLRIMIDNIFVNNPFAKTIMALVNFCNEQNFLYRKKLKFFKKMPYNSIKEDTSYRNRLIFDTSKVSGVNFK
jgi:hypothetical protein